MPDYLPLDPDRPFSPGKNRSLFPLPDPVDNGDRLCVKVYIPNVPAHRQAFLGNMLNLTKWINWERDEGETGRQAAEVWRGVFDNLLTHFYDGCPEDEPQRKCVDYLPSAPIIRYAPNDPFQTPDYLPTGYRFPPWYKNALVPLPGVLPTDAMVNLLSFASPPLVLLDSGFPRFALTVSGIGEVELEFVKIPQAGIVLIQSPGSDRPIMLIDLHSVEVTDIAGIGLLLPLLGIEGEYEIVTTEVIELHFTEAGSHEINVTFLPAFGGEVLLGFGGGLRRVSVCGLDAVGVENVAQFQVDGCLLQWRPNEISAWLTLVDLSGCVAGGSNDLELRQNPVDSCLLEYRNDPADSWALAFDYGLCLPGSGVAPDASLRCRRATGLVQEFWLKHGRPAMIALDTAKTEAVDLADAIPLAKAAYGWTFDETYDTVFTSVFMTFWDWPVEYPTLNTYVTLLDGSGLDATKKVLYASLAEDGQFLTSNAELFRTTMQGLYDFEIPSAEWDFFMAWWSLAYLINKAEILALLPDIDAGYADADCSMFVLDCYVWDVPGTANNFDTGLDVKSGDIVMGKVAGLTTYETGGATYDAGGDAADETLLKLLPGAPRNALIGRIGDAGSWFLIGKNFNLLPGSTGRLHLAVNDVVADFANNTGRITVSNCIIPAPVVSSACDMDLWDVYSGGLHGSVVERGADYITAQTTVLQGGAYYVILTMDTGAADSHIHSAPCCQYVAHEYLAGAADNLYWLDCGDAYQFDAPRYGGMGAGRSIYMLELVGSAPFTVKVTFTNP